MTSRLSLFLKISAPIFIILYALLSILIVDLVIPFIIIVTLPFLLGYWINRKCEEHNLPVLGRGYVIFSLILFGIVFFGGHGLNIIGTYTLEDTINYAKANKAPHTIEEFKELAGYNKIDPAQNGAPLLLGALKILDDRYQLWYDKLNTQQKKEIRSVVSRDQKIEISQELLQEFQNFSNGNQDLSPNIQQALSMPQCCVILKLPDEPIALLSVELRHLKMLRTYSQVMRLEIYAHLQNEKIDVLFLKEKIQNMIKLTDILASEPLLISALSKLALQSLTARSIGEILGCSNLPADFLVDIETTFQKWNKSIFEELSSSSISEYLFAYGFATQSKFEYLKNDPHIFPTIPFFFVPQGWIKLDLATLMKEEIHASISAKSEEKIREYIQTPPNEYPFYIFTNMLLVSWNSVFSKSLESLTYLRCQATALKIIQKYNETGKLPDSLEFIEQSSLTYDPFTGKPLQYHKKENSFLIYGLGPNLKDDQAAIYKIEETNKDNQKTMKDALDIGVEIHLLK